jgi:hypothetical protein
LRDALAARGVIYPAAWQSAGEASGHPGLDAAIHAGQIAAVKAELAAIARTAPRLVLLSSEGLTQLTPQELQSLRDVLQPASIRIVFHVRRWSELLPSIWQETVKHGHTHTLPEFVLSHIANMTASPGLNFGIVLDKFADVFGRDSLRLVAYNNVVDAGADLFQHFAAYFLAPYGGALDDAALADLPARPNASLPFKETELLRALNTLRRRDGGVQDNALRDWFSAHAGMLDLPAIYAAMDAYVFTLRWSDAAPPLDLLHRHLFDRYKDLLTEPAARLFAAQDVAIPHVRPDFLLEETMADAVREIYARYAADRAIRDAIVT